MKTIHVWTMCGNIKHVGRELACFMGLFSTILTTNKVPVGSWKKPWVNTERTRNVSQATNIFHIKKLGRRNLHYIFTENY